MTGMAIVMDVMSEHQTKKLRKGSKLPKIPRGAEIKIFDIGNKITPSGAGIYKENSMNGVIEDVWIENGYYRYSINWGKAKSGACRKTIERTCDIKRIES